MSNVFYIVLCAWPFTHSIRISVPQPASTNLLFGICMKATNSFIENNTVKEAPNRFRCKLPPNKLFKSEKFVRKHILNKQKSALAKIVDKVSKCCGDRGIQW